MIEVIAWMAIGALLVGVSVDSVILLIGQREHYERGSGPRSIANLHLFLQAILQLAGAMWFAVGVVSLAAILDTPDAAMGADPPAGSVPWNWSIVSEGTVRGIATIYGIIGGSLLWLTKSVVLNHYWHAHKVNGFRRKS